ncbi:MAG: hypothetical protein M1337_00150 [Actinobacteria bacterium]|nr:hypothetical protein [Actinomycetota bacterium]
MPAEELGGNWNEEAVLAAIDAAAGYPQQVQLIGDASWEQARPDNGGQILGEHVRRGLERVEQRMGSLFRSRLGKLNADHRRFIVAMASEVGAVYPDQSPPCPDGRLLPASASLPRPWAGHVTNSSTVVSSRLAAAVSCVSPSRVSAPTSEQSRRR